MAESKPAKRVKLSQSKGLILELPTITGETVAVKVAGHAKIFHIHTCVLTCTSGFFQAAMKPKSHGNPIRSIDLGRKTVSPFPIYVRWLYSGRVLFKQVASRPLENWNTLARAYILGEKLADPSFQNDVMDSLLEYRREGFHKRMPVEMIRLIYNNISTQSPIRKLIADIWAWKAKEGWTTEGLVEKTCAKFVEDVLAAMVKRRPCTGAEEDAPWVKSPEVYYVEEVVA